MSIKKHDDTYLFASNAPFLEALYEVYLKNKEAVTEEWQAYFAQFDENEQYAIEALQNAPWHPVKNRIKNYTPEEEGGAKADKTDKAASSSSHDVEVALKAAQLLDAMKNYGHMEIQYDPLGLAEVGSVPELHYSYYGLSDGDLQKEVIMSGRFGLEKAKIIDAIKLAKSAYSKNIGFEFMHLESAEERRWFENKIEGSISSFNLTNEERKSALFDMARAESFESFVHVKFPGTKRFSVEGAESSISSINCCMEQAVKFGVDRVVIGMAHRGRLNVLVGIVDMPYKAIFSQFKGGFAHSTTENIAGDVKYHLGASTDKEIAGKKIHISLMPNPSHLEVVNSIALGKVRAEQDKLDCYDERVKFPVMPILIHGDAAFSGQGSVAESLYLSNLKAYSVGGALHIVINNQVGFTTLPKDARSSRYCTDVAKAIGAPVIHVSGNDVESVIFASKIITEYRQKFKKDVVLDIVCYRKYGHNEGDEPFFTQPVMYSSIAKQKTPDIVYAEQLAENGVITLEEFNKYKQEFKALLDDHFNQSLTYKPEKSDWLEGDWKGLKGGTVDVFQPCKTGVDTKILKQIADNIYKIEDKLKLNQKLAKQFKDRLDTVHNNSNIEWGTGEALAFGSLLLEGYGVRITGQDAKRGTFSHRHSALFDQVTNDEYIPLNNIGGTKSSRFDIHNSNLSEFAVLGFEYGYSMATPNKLTIWEAQFGDFANGAQVIIDQYIASAETKWLRMSGLVLLLPHGYEGNGPEHSSARLERFLELCACNNMQVVNCSTPASFFHVLRRQLVREFRKPLVVMTPKSLLRHKHAVSKLEDMALGTYFKCVIGDELVKTQDVRRVIICSGKVYYDLLDRREKTGVYNVAIVRLEQLYPLNKLELKAELLRYDTKDIVWCQEEHKNMGAYMYVRDGIEEVLSDVHAQDINLRYVGRKESASPAVGYMSLHASELEHFLTEAFN